MSSAQFQSIANARLEWQRCSLLGMLSSNYRCACHVVLRQTMYRLWDVLLYIYVCSQPCKTSCYSS